MKTETGKKISPNARVVKYIKNKQSGMNKTQSALKAGYSKNTARKGLANVEASLTYQEAEKALSYKDELLFKITKEEIADETVKVIRQDRDNSSKLTAIRDAMKYIEPEAQSDSDERVVIVLKQD